MDTYSAAAVAEALGTTIPRVVRAVERLDLDARRPNGRLALTPKQVERLRKELGVTSRIPGVTPTEVKVLAGLRRAPFGLVSVRAAANRAGVSPTAASRALKTLEEKKLVWREPTVIVAGRARRVEVLHANRLCDRWTELTPLLARVQAPRRRAHRRDRRVPVGLHHLFWNTAPSQLDVKHGGPYIARRLLRTMDFDGLAWGARNLRPSDWEQAARARGLDPSVRALARNLAVESDA